MSTINMNFQPVAIHIVTLGDLKVEVSTNQLSLLSLYLAYTINTENSLPFDLKTINGAIVSIGRGNNSFSIASTSPDGKLFYTVLPDEDAKEWSDELGRYAGSGNPYTPYLLSHEDYGQVDQELFIYKNELGVVYITYGEDRNSSDLPVGLYVDKKAKKCYGIKATRCNEDENCLINYIFDEKSLTNLV